MAACYFQTWLFLNYGYCWVDLVDKICPCLHPCISSDFRKILFYILLFSYSTVIWILWENRTRGLHPTAAGARAVGFYATRRRDRELAGQKHLRVLKTHTAGQPPSRFMLTPGATIPAVRRPQMVTLSGGGYPTGKRSTSPSAERGEASSLPPERHPTAGGLSALL